MKTLISFIFLTLFCLSGSSQSLEGDLLISNVNIIDVERGAVVGSRDIVITGNKIASIGDHRHGSSYKGDVIDGTGKYLIPGLWDMHVHHSWDFLKLHIANGVTGIRDMGASTLSLVQIHILRQEILSGKIIGPRFIAPGPTVDMHSRPDGSLIGATTPGRGREVVDSLHAAGADFIKVYHLDRDTYFAIANQAAKVDIPISGHLSHQVTLEEAAKVGQKSIEHYTNGHPFGLFSLCSSLPEQLRSAFEELHSLDLLPRDPIHLDHRRRLMQLAVESFDEDRCRSEIMSLGQYGTWHTPTLIMGMGYPGMHDPKVLEDPNLRYLTPSGRRRFESIREFYISALTETEVSDFRQIIYRIVAHLQNAGVGILAGSDAVGGFPPYGFALHYELEELANAGLTPAEVLRTATLNPAKFLNRSNELGTVETGKIADLVLLDANPLEDISNTQKIQAVVANGRYFDRQALDKLLETAEQAANPKNQSNHKK